MQFVIHSRWILNVSLIAWSLIAGCAARQSTQLAVSVSRPTSQKPEPIRTESSDDQRMLRWDRTDTQSSLTISEDGLTLSRRELSEALWLSAQTTGRLRDGICSWEFEIETIANAQIGVGALLDPPDWGFYGYLGAGHNAWAYDTHDGAIVTETKDLHRNLPKIQERGTVSVTVDLVHDMTMTFSVDGVKTPAIPIPRGSTVIPAATLLKRGQEVTIRNFQPCKR